MWNWYHSTARVLPPVSFPKFCQNTILTMEYYGPRSKSEEISEILHGIVQKVRQNSENSKSRYLCSSSKIQQLSVENQLNQSIRNTLLVSKTPSNISFTFRLYTHCGIRVSRLFYFCWISNCARRSYLKLLEITYFNGCLQTFTPVVGMNLDGSVKKPFPKPVIKWLSDRQCSGNVDNEISVWTALCFFEPTSFESIVWVRLFIDNKCVRALRANFTANGHRTMELPDVCVLFRNRPIASRWMMGR